VDHIQQAALADNLADRRADILEAQDMAVAEDMAD
jgi:hypothetical protein